MAAVTDADRLDVAAQVARAAGAGRLPDPALHTEDARTLGSFFGAHNETVGQPVAERLAVLFALGPETRIVPRSVHAVPGERVIVVVVAVLPGSAALAAATLSFRGRRVSRIECYADAALAFDQARAPMPAPGTGAL